MTTWIRSSRSRLATAAKVGTVGGVVTTLVLRGAYSQLFGLSPLSAPLVSEPWFLLVASLLVGGLSAALLGRLTDGQVGRYDVLALAVSVAFLPAVVVFAFAVRVGVFTGFGPTVSVESFGHFVVGTFFVLLYTGFGAVLAVFTFVVVLVGSATGAGLTTSFVGKVAD